MDPLAMLRYHVSGAVARGEAEPIVGVEADDAFRATLAGDDEPDPFAPPDYAARPLPTDGVRHDFESSRDADEGGTGPCAVCGELRRRALHA